MRKKVLYLITKGNFGGAQRYIYDLATSLPKTKYEAVVAFGEGEELGKRLREAGVRTLKIDRLVREVSFLNEFRVCRDLVKLIKEEKPDVIHLNSSKIGGVGAVAGRLASLFSKDYKPKIIFTSHGWGFYESHRSNFQKVFYYISHWITVILSHKTIAVSYKTKRDMAWLPFMKERITVIHNGVESFELYEKEKARNILDPENSSKTIIYSISELHKNKGLDIAIEAISLLPQEFKNRIKYCIAGSGEENDSLIKTVEKFNLKENITFLGFVNDAKSLLYGADIFLFPSRTENLPFAVLEAGFAGLPIIATGVGGIPEIIRDMESGILVHKEKPQEIVEAMTYLMDHREKGIEFGKKIAKKIAKNFSKTKMLRETTSLYQ